MKIILLVLAFTGIVLIDVPALFKNKQWGEFAVFSVLLSIGFILSLLQIIGVKVPNPHKGIEFLVKLLPPL